jgi:hypothetical protein
VYAASHDTGSHEVNIFRSTHNESDVMNALDNAGIHTIGELVNSEIIAPRREINIVRIGLPFDFHTKDIAVEVNGVSNVSDIERNMAKT